MIPIFLGCPSSQRKAESSMQGLTQLLDVCVSILGCCGRPVWTIHNLHVQVDEEDLKLLNQVWHLGTYLRDVTCWTKAISRTKQVQGPFHPESLAHPEPGEGKWSPKVPVEVPPAFLQPCQGSIKLQGKKMLPEDPEKQEDI